MRERRRERALFVKVRGGEEAVELRGIHYKRLHHADSDTHSLTNTNIWDENDEKKLAWRRSCFASFPHEQEAVVTASRRGHSL